MGLLRANRIAVGRFAALALLLALLAPSLSHAFFPAAGDVWGSVCSAQGDSVAPSGGAGKVSADGSVLEHCPCCTLHLVAWWPSATASTALVDPRSERDWVAQAEAPASGPALWAPAWPRAPPLA